MTLKRSWQKNKAEICALLTLRMPGCVYGIQRFKDIPVFCFHSARYPDFERQMAFLKSNGYRTLDGDELIERLADERYENDGKDIVLTFDDGLSSVWSIAYPLLKRYEQKIVCFIIPGLIKDKPDKSGSLDDCSDEIEKRQLGLRDFSTEPLCNWSEIREMHDSNLVDIQSHSMSHALVSISPEIVDFIHPEFDFGNYGNTHVPLYKANGEYTRNAKLGHPVYRHAPLLGQVERFDDPPELRRECAEYVQNNGSSKFFDNSDWRTRLLEISATYQGSSSISIPRASLIGDIDYELKESKRLIESRLDKTVRHFCFPWFTANRESIISARDAGYEAVHLGAIPGSRFIAKVSDPMIVTRVQEEYLLTLPGYRGFSSMIRFKLNRTANW